MSSSVFSRRTASLLLGVCAATVAVRTTGAQERVDVATIERIKAEEMNNSQVMEIMSWLSDVYGPRLTWSPNIIRARDWAMGEMTKWGLANVHAETWDTPAGLGWQNQKFSFMATSPVPFIVEAVPQAWSGSTNGTATGKAMLVEAGCFDELKEKYAGKLKGAFIMTMPPRNEPVNAFVPTARRYTDSALAVMAAAQPAPDGGRGGGGRGGRGAGPQRSATCQKQAERDSLAALARGGRGGRGGFGGGGGLNVTDTATVSWLRQQGISAILLGDVSHVGGDIGTNNGASRAASAPRVPAVHVAQESYGRIARMVQKNVPVTLELERAEHVLRGEHDVVQHHRRDSRDRSAAQGRSRDDRRTLRLVALGHGCDRQRRRLGRDARSNETSQIARPEAAAHDPHRSLDGRGAGPAGVGGVRPPALRRSRLDWLPSDARSRRSSPRTSTSTTAAARSAASTSRASRPSVRSSMRGWIRSRAWG